LAIGNARIQCHSPVSETHSPHQPNRNRGAKLRNQNRPFTSTILQSMKERSTKARESYLPIPLTISNIGTKASKPLVFDGAWTLEDPPRQPIPPKPPYGLGLNKTSGHRYHQRSRYQLRVAYQGQPINDREVDLEVDRSLSTRIKLRKIVTMDTGKWFRTEEARYCSRRTQQPDQDLTGRSIMPSRCGRLRPQYRMATKAEQEQAMVICNILVTHSSFCQIPPTLLGPACLPFDLILYHANLLTFKENIGNPTTVPFLPSTALTGSIISRDRNLQASTAVYKPTPLNLKQ